MEYTHLFIWIIGWMFTSGLHFSIERHLTLAELFGFGLAWPCYIGLVVGKLVSK